MFLKYRILVTLSLIAWFGLINAQEFESGITSNPSLKKEKLSLKSATVDTVSLPFFDDFSGSDPYPDSKYWLDNNVFINSTYEVEPISTGVATFDALDDEGNVYYRKSTVFGADTLTSNPIKLAGKMGVYLSFFYQPKGLGDTPEEQDSLKLEFKQSNNSDWQTQFQVEGTSLEPFKQVILPVNAEYLYDGFQFRFINKVSISNDKDIEGVGANADHWNLDYVYLDGGRSDIDTTYNDVTIITPVPDIFKNYESIPWKHISLAKFPENQPEIPITVYNMNHGDDGELKINVLYYYEDIYNPEYSLTEQYFEFNLESQKKQVVPGDLTFDFSESQSKDNAKFYIRLNITDNQEDLNARRENDTIEKIVELKDYYAYDDGSPEGGYGFKGVGSENSMFALKYHTYKKDTLKNIYMYFNPTRDSTNDDLAFKLTVWNSLNNQPGQIIYENTVYVNSLSKEFEQFKIDEDIILEGDFYIGWQQLKQNFLNVGLDKNNAVTGNALINTNGYWVTSSINGAVMMRPGFGTPVTTSINNYELQDENLIVYPNPTHGVVSVKLENELQNNEYSVEIVDLLGRTLHREFIYNTVTIDVSDLNSGVYLVVLKDKTNILAKQKLLVR